MPLNETLFIVMGLLAVAMIAVGFVCKRLANVEAEFPEFFYRFQMRLRERDVMKLIEGDKEVADQLQQAFEARRGSRTEDN